MTRSQEAAVRVTRSIARRQLNARKRTGRFCRWNLEHAYANLPADDPLRPRIRRALGLER